MAGLVVGAGILATPSLAFYAATGRLLPQMHIETLKDRVDVVDWSDQGLRLADGRTVMPAGMLKFPAKSSLVAPLVRRGVEVAADGKVYGQLERRVTCGNDAVLLDVRRIDIGDFLAYARQGEFEVAPSPDDPKPYENRPLLPDGKILLPSQFNRFKASYDARVKNTISAVR